MFGFVRKFRYYVFKYVGKFLENLYEKGKFFG